MDDDPAFVRGFLSKLSASVPCTIFLESYNKVGLTETFTGTIQARPSRKSIAFTFSTGDAASVKASDLIDDIVMTPVALSRDVGPTPNAVINSLSKDTI
jgi:hypothetical protein